MLSQLKKTLSNSSPYIKSIELPSLTLSEKIEHQAHETYQSGEPLLQKITDHIFALTIKKEAQNNLIAIKKLNDIAQYVILGAEKSKFHKLSLQQIKNMTASIPPAPWYEGSASEKPLFSTVHVSIFYEQAAIKEALLRTMAGYNFSEYRASDDEHLFINNGTFNYRLSIPQLVAQTIWTGQTFPAALDEIWPKTNARFAYFGKLLDDLKKHFFDLEWTLSMGRLTFTERGLTRSVNYQALLEDIFHVNMANNPAQFFFGLMPEELSTEPWFPGVSLRSHYYHKARPEGLCIVKNGFSLCATKEHMGKQTAVLHKDRNPLKTFSLWQKRASRYLGQTSFKARAILPDSKEIDCIALVGDQIASIAAFPELIKGALESLNISFNKQVRLIGHNEDAIIIATAKASWNMINTISERASLLLRIVAKDGSDPITLFEEIKLPVSGLGNFRIKFTPEPFFKLIETVFDQKKKIPLGHSHYLLGLAYEYLHEWEEAVLHYKKALGKDAHDPDVLLALGQCLVELKRHSEAIPFFERALITENTNPALLNALGECHREIGNRDDAYKFFLHAVEQAPNNATFLMNLSGSFIELGHLDDALYTLNMALKCEPTLAQAHMMLAEIYRRKNDGELAKKHALIAFNLNPSDRTISETLWGITRHT